jgi:hypothetical protein
MGEHVPRRGHRSGLWWQLLIGSLIAATEARNTTVQLYRNNADLDGNDARREENILVSMRRASWLLIAARSRGIAS